MQKKAGQISSNTLSLRFMQNAAKAQNEKEVEAAKAKVRSEEEWELSPDVRQSYGIDHQGEDHGITYEQSYLPFLFPRLSNRPTASTSNAASSEGEEDEDADSPRTVFKGRRTFGKHGNEEVEKPTPEPPLPSTSSNITALSRGPRTISSHGCSTATAPKQKPNAPPSLPLSPELKKRATGPTEFIKPEFDAQKEERMKRSSEGYGVGDGQRKTKKRRPNFGDGPI